jgi:hypothetical protein
VWGALNARAGFVAADAGELPPAARDYVDRLVAPYFSAVVAWCETLGVGVTGGALHGAVMRRIGDPFFGVGLNPGHLIHLDEWLNSPIAANSTTPLRSGMAIQVDVIPATHSPWFTTNIEDGVALADADLRAAFADPPPGGLGPHPGPPRVHDRRPRHPPEAGGPAVQQHSRLAAALPAGAGARHGGLPRRRRLRGRARR